MKVLLHILILLYCSSPIFSIDVVTWSKDAKILASDEFQGRGVGQEGEVLAGNYLAGRFAEIGLNSFPELKGYHQKVPLSSCEVEQAISAKTISKQGETQVLQYEEDFLLFNKCNLLTGEQVLKVQFAGFGIMDIESGWDDYSNINVEGRLAIIFEGKPVGIDMEYQAYSINEKRENAISQGAAGVLFVPLIEDYDDWTQVKEHLQHSTFQIGTGAKSSVSITQNPQHFNAVINPFSLSKFGISLTEYAFIHSQDYSDLNTTKRSEINNSSSGHELVYGLSTFQVELQGSNIVGYLPPKGTEEFLLISAHFDHLGIGQQINGDSIYNGFYDNAMGVATLLSLAEKFAEHWHSNDNTNSKGIIFLLTTAEEKGLLGASFFTKNSPIDNEKIIANINIDGIAGFGVPKGYFVLGSHYSNLGTITEEVLQSRGEMLEEAENYFGVQDYFLSSDQYAFALAGIPSIRIVDGVEHKDKSRQSVLKKIDYYTNYLYHTPADDYDVGFDSDGMISHTQLIFRVAEEVIDNEQEVHWFTTSPYQRTSQTEISFGK